MLNKKILLSIGTIAFVVAVAAGSTYAVWSATTTIEDNSVSTATVSLGQTGLVEKPINGVDMLPGDYTEPGKVGIHNTSSVDLRLYMHTDDLSDNSVNGICDNTLLSLYTGHAGSAPNTDGDGKIIDGQNDEAHRHIATKSVLKWAGELNREELTGNPPFDELQPNWTQNIWQQAQLDENAPNNLQGQTCTWDEIFTGETT